MTNVLEEVVLIPVIFCLNNISKALQTKITSKRLHTTFIVKWLFIVAEIPKEAMLYASIEELVNTDTDEVHHGS